jgi:DNA-binding NarL/FixJ family response regulator
VQALRAGANGYLMKSGDEQELIDGIEKVMLGQLVLGAGVPERMVDGMIGKRSEASKALTESERQVLLYVAAGYENDEISRKISMPLPTLIETLAQSMNKLQAKDRHAAALKALRQGVISLENLHEL